MKIILRVKLAIDFKMKQKKTAQLSGFNIYIN